MKLKDLIEARIENPLEKWIDANVTEVMSDSHDGGTRYVDEYVSTEFSFNDNKITFHDSRGQKLMAMKMKEQPKFSNDMWSNKNVVEDPSYLYMNFDITDWSKIPSIFSSYFVDGRASHVSTLKGIKEFKTMKSFFMRGDGISMKKPIGVLELLKVQRLEKVRYQTQPLSEVDRAFEKVLMIIQKYLKADRSLVDCQTELIEAGFEDWAKL